jgi:protein-tyrosine phosphatase
MKILFVCLGNICRSPLAEAILRHINPYIMVDSAGTSNYHIGSPPDIRMVETAQSYGIDISNLAARQFTIEDFNRFDKIFIMDDENYRNVVSLAEHESHVEKVHYTLSKQNNVPDPYFGEKDGFIQVYEMLHQACQTINDEIKER